MTLEDIKNKVEAIQESLEVKQTELAQLFSELDSESLEEETKDELESKIKTLSDEIEALKETGEAEYSKYRKLKPLGYVFENDSENESDNKIDNDALELMVKSMGIGTKNKNEAKKTPGQYIGDYLKSLGVNSYDSFERAFSGTSFVPFYFNVDETDLIAKAELNQAKSIKSLYVNGGEELDDGGTPVPGFQGFGCARFEVDQECMPCFAANRTFVDALTIRNMPSGSYIEYSFPVDKVNNAGGVLETVYNPYPTKFQDGKKPVSNFTYNDAKVKVSKLAHAIIANDEALEDCSKIADRIDWHLTGGLLEERDRQLIDGAGTGGELLGLLRQPGTVALDSDTLVTAAGVTDSNIWDRLYLSMLELEKNCAVTDTVFVNPSDRAKVALAKDDQGNYLFPQSGMCDVQSVGCLMLKTSPDIPVGTAIIGEFANNWVLYMRKNLTIKVGMTGDQFLENARTFLAELRAAAVLFCPEKIAIVTNI